MKAEVAEEDRLRREREEEASRAVISKMFDEVTTQIDADREVAARMAHEDYENYTVEMKSKMLVELFETKKKQKAAERALAIRSKPPTKLQLRNIMMTYLKNMGSYKHNHLKFKTTEEIQVLYERQKKRIQDFTPMDSEKDV